MDVKFKIVTPNEENGLKSTDKVRYTCQTCGKDVLGTQLEGHALFHAAMNGEGSPSVIVDSRF